MVRFNAIHNDNPVVNDFRSADRQRQEHSLPAKDVLRAAFVDFLPPDSILDIPTAVRCSLFLEVFVPASAIQLVWATDFEMSVGFGPGMGDDRTVLADLEYTQVARPDTKSPFIVHGCQARGV